MTIWQHVGMGRDVGSRANPTHPAEHQYQRGNEIVTFRTTLDAHDAMPDSVTDLADLEERIGVVFVERRVFSSSIARALTLRTGKDPDYDRKVSRLATRCEDFILSLKK